MPYRNVNQVGPFIANIKAFDGDTKEFTTWRSRLRDIMTIQGVLDVVDGTLKRPVEDKPFVRTAKKGYNPNESAADWDVLSELARATIKLTLSTTLSLRYEDVRPASKLYSLLCAAHEKNTRARRIQLFAAFWHAKHDPTLPIAAWINSIKVSAADLQAIRMTPSDQTVADRLVMGLDDSWSSVRDSLMMSVVEVVLDDVISSLEAHELNRSFAGLSTTFDGTAAAVAKRIRCKECGKAGHTSSNCWANKNKAKAKAAFEVNNEDGCESDWSDRMGEDLIYL